jgi:hypothetical protein
MPKPGDDIKGKPLYAALAALGTNHRSMRLEVLKRYSAITKAPEVRRRAARRTSFDQLAAAARTSILAAIDEMRDERLHEVANAVLCATTEYEGLMVKERIGALEKKLPGFDRDAYKYLRLVALERTYRFLTRTPSADNDWLASGFVWGWPMNPAGWEVAPELLPSLGRLRFRIAQLGYGALATTFVSRFNDRLDAQHYDPWERLASHGNTFPTLGDFFFVPWARFALARDEFEARFAHWRSIYTSVWQEARLSNTFDMLEAFQAPFRELGLAWAAESGLEMGILAQPSGELLEFYARRWLPWLGSVLPRYATSGFDALAYIAGECRKLQETLRDLFGYDPVPNQSARTEAIETLSEFYKPLSRSVVVDGKPLHVTITEYLDKRIHTADEPIVWHRLHLGSGRTTAR